MTAPGRRYRPIILGLCLILHNHSAAAAQRALGSFGAWQAFAFDEGGQTACFMIDTRRTGAGPVPPSRKPPYLMITHRPAEASSDVFSYGAGAALDTRRDARLSVGPAAFALFTAQNTGWAREALTDHKIAQVLTAGVAATVTLQAQSSSGAILDDAFDVTGAEAAYHAIGLACGLIHEAPKPKPGIRSKIKTMPAPSRKSP